MASWLFMAIGIGGRLGSCDWDKKVTNALDKSISASRFRSHIISRAASEAAIYSVSHVDSATISCLLDSQAIDAPAPRNRYPLVDL
jgi:hypothetical protein